MRRILFAAALILAPAACGGAAEKKTAGDAPPAPPDKKAEPAPPSLPHADRKDDPTVLIPGDPPLTQDMMNLYRMAMDYILDLQITDLQRDEYQRLFLEDWKKDPKEWGKAIESWRKPLSARPYDRRARRVRRRPSDLDALRKSDAESDRWLLAAYEAAHKPGSERNPILADGDPPLTRDEAELYCDRVEFGLDLSVLGGLTPDQRRRLQDLLVRDWKGMDASGKGAFLRELNRGYDKAALLAQLRGKPGEERSLFLLEVYKQEQDQAARRMEDLKMRQPMQYIADEIRGYIGDPHGHYRYNPSTGRNEWVPDP